MTQTSTLETATLLPVPQAANERGLRTLRSRVSHRTLLLTVILTAQLMVVLDGTIVNVALPYIQRDLKFSTASLSWVISAYTLTFGGLLLLGARAGDLLGRRRMFLAGIALFSIASLVGGFATTSWFLLSARALQGVGGAFAAPATLAVLTSVFPEGRERLRALGLFTAVSVGGAATGLVAGGVLTQVASWRWVMFVNAPIGIAVFVLGRFVIPETPRHRGRFDISGALTSTLGLGAIVFGFVEAAEKGWAKPLTITSLVGGVLLVAGFVAIERTAEAPILPLRLFSHRGRTSANVARAMIYAGLYGLFYYLTQFLQDVLGYSPMRTGLALVPIPLTVFTLSQLTSKVLVHRYPMKRLMLIGIAMSTTGVALSTQLHASSGYPQVLLSLLLFGAGNGISFVTLTSASLTEVPVRDAGAASGLINVTQQLGPALGVAILATIFGSATKHAIIHPQPGPAGESVRAIFVHGMNHALVGAAGFMLIGFLLVATMIRSAKTGSH